jgi:hypothetical protein
MPGKIKAAPMAWCHPIVSPKTSQAANPPYKGPRYKLAATRLAPKTFWQKP